MEFSSIWYFSFWSLVSLIFSTTGKHALRKASIPISDFAKAGFECLITISIWSSISYAFLFRPALEQGQQELSAAQTKNFLLSFHIGFASIISSIISTVSSKGLSLLFSAVGTSLYVMASVAGGFGHYQTIGNLLTAFAGPLIMYPYHTLCWKPITGSTMAAHACEHRKIFEIIFGMLGTTLAQYYFRVKSVALMLGLLSWSIAWLGNLANVQPFTDFGIFHFLVTGSIECAVSLFGLHFYTFLVVCGGIVLMILRWKAEFVSLRHSGGKDIVMRDWKRLEELYRIDSNDSSIRTYDPEQPSEGASDAQRLGI